MHPTKAPSVQTAPTINPSKSLTRHTSTFPHRPSMRPHRSLKPSPTPLLPQPTPCLPPLLPPPTPPLNPHPQPLRSIADALHLARRRAPFDNEYLLGLVWRERRHLALAATTLLLCTASNLAAPVLSGMLLEMLVSGQPLTKYAEVRLSGTKPRSSDSEHYGL